MCHSCCAKKEAEKGLKKTNWSFTAFWHQLQLNFIKRTCMIAAHFDLVAILSICAEALEGAARQPFVCLCQTVSLLLLMKLEGCEWPEYESWHWFIYRHQYVSRCAGGSQTDIIQLKYVRLLHIEIFKLFRLLNWNGPICLGEFIFWWWRN